jgi:type IV secretion system protein VirB10
MDGGFADRTSAYGTGHEAPDLDANAPLLRSSDVQRLNRKALVFLAGIVALLLVSVSWMFSDAGADATPAPRAEKVVIPELPQTHRMQPGVAPVPVVSAPDEAMPLPPLPPVPQGQEASFRPSFGSPPVASQAQHEPTLLERRTGGLPPDQQANAVDPYTRALLAGMPAPPGMAQQSAPMAVRSDASSARFLQHPDTLLVRGTYIRCVLETRIVTDIPGFTSCVVTEPVYSINGRTLLLSKGSKLSGRYDSDANGPRVAVAWDRITTPNGIDVRMASPGVDNLGGAGHPGDFDAHWPSRMGAALMISLVSDLFKYEGETHGPRTTTVSNGIVTQAPFDSNTARTMERLANQALDRSINRPATVTIIQGTVVNVYVAKDVDFNAVVGPAGAAQRRCPKLLWPMCPMIS